jgi:hypothetical protein
MKNELKKTFKTTLLTTLILLVVLLSIKSVKYYQESRKQPKTVYVTDTLTNIVYDTVFLDHYKTKKLYLTDTITNTLIKDSLRIDSVFVEIPISVYSIDTSFVTDSTILNLYIRNSGYDVTMDTLTYNLKYTTKKRTSFGIFAGPMTGLSFDGKLTVGVGFGVGIFL